MLVGNICEYGFRPLRGGFCWNLFSFWEFALTPLSWLNEGWTTYLERRIQAGVHGEPHRDFSAIIGWKALRKVNNVLQLFQIAHPSLVDSVDRFGHTHEYTKLVIDLNGKDPDDAFSSVPYEKVRSCIHTAISIF